MPAIHRFGGTLLDAIYPPACLLCETPLAGGPRELMLCDACRSALTFDPHATCPRCSSTVGPGVDAIDGCVRCRDAKFHFHSLTRLGPYDGKLRDAVLKIKHLNGESLAETLGLLWLAAHRERFLSLQPHIVIPVPLHFTRRWQRGYNQAQSLAEQLAVGLGVPCRSTWLRRVRRTPMQSGVSAAARRANMKGAFALSRGVKVSDLRILLIDDVLTTGATVDAAATAILKGGAAQVDVAILAHR